MNCFPSFIKLIATAFVSVLCFDACKFLKVDEFSQINSNNDGNAFGISSEAANEAIERARAAIQKNGDAVPQDQSHSFSVRDVVVDTDGAEHVRFNRNYKGLRIVGGDLVVHSTKNKEFDSADLAYKNKINLDIKPAITTSQAVTSAKTSFSGKPTAEPYAELIIFTRGGDAKLAYEVTLKGLLNDSIPIQRQIFVDAGNLAILENWELPYSPKNAGDRKFSGNIPFERVIAEKRADIAYATAHFRSTGESGGLNEASKEIFASLFEQDVSARKDSNKGSMSALAFGATGLSKEYRAMHNPALDGSSPNCYSSALNSLSTLQASGVARHFFYLLAEGSQPASPLPHSPTCNFSSLSGIGRNKAARIWYRAVTVYMTSTTNYLQAADATFKAATDIFGLSSTEANAVVATWAAVSVTTPTLVLAAAPTPGMPSQAIAASEGETPQEITTSTHSAETDCKKGARGTVSTNGYTKVSIGPYHGVNWLWSELEQRCIEGTPFSNGGSTRFFLELRSAYVVSTRVNGDCGLRQFVVRQVFADGHTEDTLLIDSEPGVKSFNPPAVILESQSTPSLPAGGCP